MRWRYTLYVVGVIIAATGASMLFALAFALYYDDGGVLPLLKSVAAAFIVGGGMILVFREKGSRTMTHREGMAIVTLGWLGAGIVGAVPFYLGGVFESFTDCVFESVSGFTTTGASVLPNIEAQSKGLLMWRSLTHWLGGMGIIVLALAILPFLGVGGMQLYKSEVPGPTPDKLKPRIKDTAMLLWQVYVLLSAAEVVLLMFGGLNLYEALCHTFGTMATGGFSTKNNSIAFYDSGYIHTVITVFMLMAGANFSLHYHLLRGRPQAFWKDPEFRFYIGVFVVFTAVSVASVLGVNYETLGEAIRYCSFQVASILTTTGYVTADYEQWTPLPQCLLLLLMFLGGSAGSTGGGMKCMRLLLLMKHAHRELFRLVHPRAVTQVKLGGKTVPTEIMSSIWGFFLLYLGLFIVSTFIMASMGVDVVTSFASVAACIGNIGPGLGAVGPADNYAHIPLLGKWLLIFCMLLGRLEIYTVIILFVPEFWRK
jgi:trk system potassium uptake protein TrkH